MTKTRRLLASVFASAVLALGVAAPASAQQNGLVNVQIGDITILENVGVGVAANVAAQICGVQVNAAVIARQVVRNDAPLAVCKIRQGDAEAPVTITP